jgi:hypothetical protein
MKLKTIQVLIKYQHVLAQVLREHAIVIGVELLHEGRGILLLTPSELSTSEPAQPMTK